MAHRYLYRQARERVPLFFSSSLLHHSTRNFRTLSTYLPVMSHTMLPSVVTKAPNGDSSLPACKWGFSPCHRSPLSRVHTANANGKSNDNKDDTRRFLEELTVLQATSTEDTRQLLHQIETLQSTRRSKELEAAQRTSSPSSSLRYIDFKQKVGQLSRSVHNGFEAHGKCPEKTQTFKQLPTTLEQQPEETPPCSEPEWELVAADEQEEPKQTPSRTEESDASWSTAENPSSHGIEAPEEESQAETNCCRDKHLAEEEETTKTDLRRLGRIDEAATARDDNTNTFRPSSQATLALVVLLVVWLLFFLLA